MWVDRNLSSLQKLCVLESLCEGLDTISKVELRNGLGLPLLAKQPHMLIGQEVGRFETVLS